MNFVLQSDCWRLGVPCPPMRNEPQTVAIGAGGMLLLP